VVSSVIRHNDYGVYVASARPTLSPSNEVSVKFSTVSDNRYEDVLLDQGRTFLGSDRIEGGDVGLMALQYHGQSYGDFATIAGCRLQSSTVAAVQILSDQAATGDFHGSLTFRSTTIHGPILSNSSSYTVTFVH